jgi:hypothetical protein
MLTEAEEKRRDQLYSGITLNPRGSISDKTIKLIDLEAKDIVTDNVDAFAAFFDRVKIEASEEMGVDIFSNPELEEYVDEIIAHLVNKQLKVPWLRAALMRKINKEK